MNFIFPSIGNDDPIAMLVCRRVVRDYEKKTLDLTGFNGNILTSGIDLCNTYLNNEFCFSGIIYNFVI
jgi:hypothetical protein